MDVLDTTVKIRATVLWLILIFKLYDEDEDSPRDPAVLFILGKLMNYTKDTGYRIRYASHGCILIAPFTREWLINGPRISVRGIFVRGYWPVVFLSEIFIAFDSYPVSPRDREKRRKRWVASFLANGIGRNFRRGNEFPTSSTRTRKKCRGST